MMTSHAVLQVLCLLVVRLTLNENEEACELENGSAYELEKGYVYD